MIRKAINGIEIVLIEKNLSSKWLAEPYGENEVTIPLWCTNYVRLSLTELVKVAKLTIASYRNLLSYQL